MRFVAVKLGDGEEVRLEKKITDKKWNINGCRSERDTKALWGKGDSTAEIVIEIDIETYEMAEELAKAWNCSVEEAIIKAIMDFYREILESSVNSFFKVRSCLKS